MTKKQQFDFKFTDTGFNNQTLWIKIGAVEKRNHQMIFMSLNTAETLWFLPRTCNINKGVTPLCTADKKYHSNFGFNGPNLNF
jgi:hypothetical protein